ncbi:MAG: PrsW family intramembrane metalloprotease [Treponema sp.]|nr:PrsW family intramembrane metalloprotease [Treponema sp.]
MFGIALCFLPLIVAVLIFTLAFKLKFSHQLIAILFGLIAVLPISFIQYFLPEIPFFNTLPLLKTLLKSMILYGLVEELLKLLLAYPLPHKNYTSLNFLLLTFVMGLALGCFESVVYYFEHLQSAHAKGAQILYGMIAARIFSSDLIHMCCMGLSGLFIFSSREKKAQISCFIFAVLLHGVYDFFVGFPNNLKWFSAVVVLLSLAECRIKYVSLQDSEK